MYKAEHQTGSMTQSTSGRSTTGGATLHVVGLGKYGMLRGLQEVLLVSNMEHNVME